MSLKQTTLKFTLMRDKCKTNDDDDLTKSSGIKVVNAKVTELRKLGYRSLADFLNASEDHLYVGRDMSRFVCGAVKSKCYHCIQTTYETVLYFIN